VLAARGAAMVADMTVTFYDWQAGLQPGKPYDYLSPNLVAVRNELAVRFGGTPLGDFVVRAIRAGFTWSSHSFGSAINWRIEDAKARRAAMDWLIEHHVLLGIQVIHDYVGCRIWHANRYPGKDAQTWWRPQPKNPRNGMGQAWAKYLHIETDRSNWLNSTPVYMRGQVAPVTPPTTVLFDPAKGIWGLYPLDRNKNTIREVTSVAASDNDRALCRYLQGVLRLKASQDVKVDGDFGPSTGDAVERFQRYLGLKPDRVVGPVTWGWIDRMTRG